MENLALLAFLFIVVVLAIVGGAAYWADSLADRHDQNGG
jgi:hypothetical protein